MSCILDSFGLGLFDRDGVEIRCGDLVLHLNESKHTKRDYWYPIYKIVWNKPCFRALWVSGGKGSDLSFCLKNYSSELLVVNEYGPT